MAHLIYNSSKPYSIDLPRPFHPLSPPDTDNEYPPQMHTPGTFNPSQLGQDHESPINPYYPTLGEHPTVPIGRRTSALSYINSASRESRERTVLRGPRWLLVVMPPRSFSREHGNFGNTLSTGSADRLSQGILVPLFPTMGSQLNAIAREFGLPSSVGLCIYLHTQQNGLSLSPRVSDDTWHLLWSHLFEPRSPVTPIQQMPICGQVEFDIDLTRARWYDAWLMSSRKEAVDVPHSITHSRKPSSHLRGESKTTILDDDQAEHSSTAAPPARGGRNAPRRLSLLDRFDASSSPAPRVLSRQLSPDSPTGDTNLLRTLSPIVQEIETPRKKDVDGMVNSWRASASLTPSALAHTGQTSLDPANLPNTMDESSIKTAVSAVEEELDLNEYTWSISSAGPPEYDDDLDLWESIYAPSVHLDRRLEGSVLLTPTTATSFGPPDHDPYLDDLASSYNGSIHLDRRVEGSVLLTRSVCTSYGPLSDDSYQWSAPSSRVASPDIAQRSLEDDDNLPPLARKDNAPSSVVVQIPPAEPRTVELVAVPKRSVEPIATPALVPVDSVYTEVRPWGLVWPYAPKQFVFARSSQAAAKPLAPEDEPCTWKLIWPYTASPALTIGDVSPGALAYPFVQPYPTVYPFVEPYPTLVRSDPAPAQQTTKSRVSIVVPLIGASSRASTHRISRPAPVDLFSRKRPAEVSAGPVVPPGTWAQVWPYSSAGSASIFGRLSRPTSVMVPESSEIGVWKKLWPYTQSSTVEESTLGVPASGYPSFNIYLPVYPFFDLYPSVLYVFEETVDLVEKPAYPYLDLYPTLSISELAVRPVQVTLQTAYPLFDLYPAVYPWNLYKVYPPAARHENPSESTRGIAVGLPWHYPQLRLYAPVYPYNLEAIYPPRSQGQQNDQDARGISCKLFAAYPTLEPYIPMYPHNLASIYPARALENLHSIASVTDVVYPVFNIYLPVGEDVAPFSPASRPESGSLVPVSISLRHSYPSINLYPAVYPWNLESVYSPLNLTPLDADNATSSSSYTPVYPHNLEFIYVPVCPPTMSAKIVVTLPVLYPAFDLYPAVYPKCLLEIYPTVSQRSRTSNLAVSLPLRYPRVSPYRPAYPFLEIYPSIIAEWSSSEELVVEAPEAQRQVAKRRRFTHAELHVQVFEASRDAPSTPPSAPALSATRGVPSSSGSPVTRSRARSGTVNHRHNNSPSSSSTVLRSPLPAVTNRRTELPPVPRVPPKSSHSRTPSSTPSPISELSTAFPMPPPSRHASISSVSVPRSVSFARGTRSTDSPPPSPRQWNARSNNADLRRSATTTQKPALPTGGADLGRAKTLPSKSILRPSRSSVVLEKARAYDLTSDTSRPDVPAPASLLGPVETAGSTRVSRLDRSKYPFL